MHPVVLAHTYFFWVKCHPSRTFLLKDIWARTQKQAPISPHHQTTPSHTLDPWPTSHVLAGYKQVVPGPYVYAPLLSESTTFLVFKPLPLPLHLSDSTVRFDRCLKLLQCARYMGLWVHVLCFPSLLQTGHCLGVGPLLPAWPMSSSFLCSWASWLVILHATTLLLLYHCLFFISLLPIGLRVGFQWPKFLLYQPTFHIFTSFGFYWTTFLPCQPISFFLNSVTSSLPLLLPWAFAKSFGLPWPNYHILTSYQFSGLLAFKPTL